MTVGVELERSGGIARISFGDPARSNAMNAVFWSGLRAAFEAIEDSSEIRVAIISTQGRNFSSGIDLGLLQSMAPRAGVDSARELDQLRRTLIRMQKTFTAVEQCRVPVIAVVQGACLGAGLDLVAACDICYASEDAFFSIHETNIGLPADLGSLQRLPRRMSRSLLRELAFTGRRFSAAEAHAAGLVASTYHTHEAALGQANMIAEAITSKSPLAVIGTKKALDHAEDATVSAGLDYIATWNAGLVSYGDLAEGMRAAAEKRQPEFANLL